MQTTSITATEALSDESGKLRAATFPSADVDIADKHALRKVFEQYDIEGAVMLAGYKAVGESVGKPLMYYRNNLDICLSLLELMEEFDAKRLIFSSSATVRALQHLPSL